MTESEAPKVEEPVSNLPPVKLAFIIDGEVVDILHTDERLAAIFLSEPKIVDVSDKLPLNDNGIVVGASYNEETGVFTAPPAESEE